MQYCRLPMVTATSFSNSRLRSPAALLFVVCLAQFMVILDVSVVNVALPTMRAVLHLSSPSLQAVVNAYTLTLGRLLMLRRPSPDPLGRLRVFLLGTAGLGPGV